MEFGDDDAFEVTPGGVLVIHRGDRTTLYLNHTQWDTIEETPKTPVAGVGSVDGVTEGEFDAATAGF